MILDSLRQSHYKPDGRIAVINILKWADNNNAFEQNILGPTSKLALNLIREGKDTGKIANTALSNGAAMRIAPVGCLFEANELQRLADYVKDISKETHSSDITIAGAVLVAAAVAVGMECGNTKEAVRRALELEEYALSLGAETFSASIRRRVEVGMEFAVRYKDDEKEFLKFVYEVIGSGVPTSESVSAALTIAYYAEDPNRCALMCANLGGDTDTIGAMATAICGAAAGIEAFEERYIRTIDRENHINMQVYADILQEGRSVLHE